jgi:hypothetical protein
MVGRRRWGAGRIVSIVIAAVILGSAARSGAEPWGASRPRASLLAGPSLRETGRVADIPLAHASWRVEHAPERAVARAPSDPVVRPRTAGSERSPAGSLSATIIAHELERPMAALQDCRIEVARQSQQTWNAVAAGRVTLRFMILPAGTVAHIDVVPVDPLDLHVLDCVKRTVALWTFARPRDGAVAVTAPFAFR